MQAAGDPVRIQLTGQVRVVSEASELGESELPGRQGRLVLAALALAGEPVHRDVLADALWPDGLPATWERTLSGVISRLRSAFVRAGFEGLTIANAFECYELQVPVGAEVDVREAAARTTDAERSLAVGDLAAARTAATNALDVARRPLLAGEEATWIALERQELKAVCVRALDVLATATMGGADAVDAATEALGIDPFRESSHVLLMRAHVAVGNTADALLAYERCRELLADELGVDPSTETQELHLSLLRAGEDAVVGLLESQGLVTLPVTHTAFIGRALELISVGTEITDSRVVTLTGPGGVGKTRLAIEVARNVVAAFADGVHLIDLTTATGSSTIAEHAGAVLGLRGQGSLTVGGIADVLGPQRVLLVLDNCEHILGVTAAFVSELVLRTSGVAVLCTSREPLGVADEVVYPVPSLDVPDEHATFDRMVGSESIALFELRAGSARPDFLVTAASVDQIATICRDLDGIPLAIELAAAQVGTMSVVEIAENLGERLAFAQQTEGDMRHRTLRATIDWSYDLLGRAEAGVFRRCSVFDGGFTAGDAGAVCDRDVGAELAALAARSIAVVDESSGEPRYRLLETIKQYARERAAGSDEWEASVERHIDRYASIHADLHARKDETLFMSVSRLSQADATAALTRALDRGRILDGVKLARLLWKVWMADGLFTESKALLERTIEAATAAGAANELTELFVALGAIHHNEGDRVGARALHTRALEVATALGDESARAGILGHLASNATDGEAMFELATQGLAAALASGNDFAAGYAYVLLSNARQRGGGDGDSSDTEKALEHFSKIRHRAGMARAMWVLAIERYTASPDDGSWRELVPRALALAREDRDRFEESLTLHTLGGLHAEVGEHVEALPHLQEALRLYRRVGNTNGTLEAIGTIAQVVSEAGDPMLAATLLAAVQSIAGGLGLEPQELDEKSVEQIKARAGDALDRAWTAGAALTLEEAYELARSTNVAAAIRA